MDFSRSAVLLKSFQILRKWIKIIAERKYLLCDEENLQLNVKSVSEAEADHSRVDGVSVEDGEERGQNDEQTRQGFQPAE